MSYQYNYSVKNESESSEFVFKTYIKLLGDFQIPNYSISVIPSIVVTKPDGTTIEHPTGLTNTTDIPSPDLFNTLKFFKVAVYRKFNQETENKIITSQLEKFGFVIDDLNLDISTNFLDESAINKIVTDLAPDNELRL